MLGLIAEHELCTSYDLKSLVVERLGGLWTVPHAQLYSEPDRLAEHGLLHRDIETGGRHRKLFRVTASGREVVGAWLVDEHRPGWEVRDDHLVLLALASGAGRSELVPGLAKQRRDGHEERIAEHLAPAAPGADDLPCRLALHLELAARDFWAEIADDQGPGSGGAPES
ncbi:PadR family transcriptional regulator [Actinomycetospora flava]|uniref:PadR family transcriptional regulator n=1 Tax=Actinomycetospora flava TaxID=3129232 RepID=A0ABU8MFX1_9PSEU